MRSSRPVLHGSRGLTLIEIIIIIIVLGVIAFFGIRAVLSSGGGGGGRPAAATQLTWITQPASFPKNTPTRFEVELQRLNSAVGGRWDPFGGEETLVGVVLPASVSIQTINGDPPASATPIPANLTIPGLSGGGTAHPTETTSAGRIVFMLNGTEPADGQLTVIYVRADGNHTVSTITFSVTE